jgi:phosphoserine aminotransferase
LFYGLADKEDRSLMNVTFRTHDINDEAEFLKYAQKCGMIGVKGYRTVGGFRASLYNALPYESVEALVKCMAGYTENKLMQNIESNAISK